MSATATASAKQAGSQVSAPVAGTTGLDETVRTIVALAIVLAGLVVIIGAWALRPVSDAEAVSSVMTGLMGGVLGYYFGASGKAKSDAAANTATAKADAAKDAKAKVLGPVAEAMGKLKVTGTPTGETRMRAAVAGQPATPVDEAIADLQKVVDQLS